MAESKRESRLMIGLVIAFAIALVGAMVALLAADSGSVMAAQVARLLAPIAVVLGCCMFLARILDL